MGTELHITGRFRRRGLLSRAMAPAQCIDAIEQWFTAHCRETWPEFARQSDPDAVRMGIGLHPAAEWVQVEARPGGRVTIGAKTTGGGPGYHAYVCDALKQLGADEKIEWDPPDAAAGTGDPTGYFHTGDFDAVLREMLAWLGTVTSNLLKYSEQGYEGMAVSLPEGVGFHHDGAVATPMGPRSRQWLVEVADAPGRGSDIFPWLHRGTGASYYLGRALARMWTDIRWRKPGDDKPLTLMVREVLTCLERGYAADPSLDYPWREWEELQRLVGEPVRADVGRRATDARGASAPLIGYRRRNITARPMDQWSLEVPGSFQTILNDDGSWQAYEDDRAVYFSSLVVQAKPGNAAPSAAALLDLKGEDSGKVLETFKHNGPRVIGRATFNEVNSNGRTYWQLSGLSAVTGKVGLCTIDIYDRAQKDWALGVWKSVDHPVGD